MQPKVMKLDGQVYGLDLEFKQLDKINEIQDQRAAVEMTDLLHSQRFKDMFKGISTTMGMAAGAMEKMERASEHTDNEDALRYMNQMRNQMSKNMDEALREIEAVGDTDEVVDSDNDENPRPKLRASVGWFENASDIQIETAFALQKVQDQVVAAVNTAVFNYVNANLRKINKSISQSGVAAPSIKKLGSESEALGLYGFNELFLNPLKRECRLLGTLHLTGGFEDYPVRIAVNLDAKKPQIKVEVETNNPD